MFVCCGTCSTQTGTLCNQVEAKGKRFSVKKGFQLKVIRNLICYSLPFVPVLHTFIQRLMAPFLVEPLWLEDNISEAENGDTISISYHGRQPPTGNGNVQKKAPVPFFLSHKRIWATSETVHTYFLYTACHTIAADEM